MPRPKYEEREAVKGKQLKLKITVKQHGQLIKLAKDQNVSMSKLIRRFIDKAVEDSIK